jgi:hypothetical protein
MKVFVCNCFPHEMEFGGVVVAETEQDAKMQLKDIVVKGSWVTDIKSIELVEINLSKPNALIIDPVKAF